MGRIWPNCSTSALYTHQRPNLQRLATMRLTTDRQQSEQSAYALALASIKINSIFSDDALKTQVTVGTNSSMSFIIAEFFINS